MNSRITPFWYDLPAERIAARPLRPYDAAKLLVLNRSTGELSDSIFSELPKLLSPKDVLVFNNSRVLKSRLFGHFEESGGELEVLVLERERVGNELIAKALGRPLKRFKEGKVLRFTEGFSAVVEERLGTESVRLKFKTESGDISAEFEKAALMPIPPYIRQGRADSADDLDYQTCFAKIDGAIAAPTASLHFTPELIKYISGLGCALEFLTLHVGRASFSTLWEPGQEQLSKPGPEIYKVDLKLLQRLRSVRANGGRIVAIGTTVVRALESMCRAPQNSEWLDTELFITPGFEFQMVDALVTNFHQPGTTHLLLVEALIGSEALKSSYSYALEHDFRFLSYGDGMVVI